MHLTHVNCDHTHLSINIIISLVNSLNYRTNQSFLIVGAKA